MTATDFVSADQFDSRSRKRARRGLTLLEVLLALGLGATALIAAVLLFTGALGRTQTTETQQVVQSLIQDLRIVYGSQSNYAGLDEETAIAIGVVPPSLQVDDSTISNPYGGDIAIGTEDNDRSMTLAVDQIPDDACVNLVTSTVAGASGGIQKIRVGTRLLYDRASTNPDDREVTVADAQVACDGGDNTIVWTAR